MSALNQVNVRPPVDSALEDYMYIHRDLGKRTVYPSLIEQILAHVPGLMEVWATASTPQ